MVSEPFASVLRSGREHFNALFAHARRQHSGLDAGALRDFLQEQVDPLVRAVADVRPERVTDVAMAAYETALALCAQRLAGPGARTPALTEGWRRLAPPAAPLIAAEPRAVLSAISNALHQLASTAGARPLEWIAAMERHIPAATDVETFLKLGQVAAWRAGLAHFRESALAVADTLPEPLALSAVGAVRGGWATVRRRLAEDPWYAPGSTKRSLRIAGRAGGFRGFGGPFAEPPEVAGSNGHFYVRSGSDCWLLAADAFGATLHRATLEEFGGAAAHAKILPGFHVGEGGVEWDGQRVDLSRSGEITSCAVNQTTAAVTASLTHRVILIALGSKS